MLKKQSFHSILFAAIPVIFLYSQNFDKIKFVDILIPLALSFGIGLSIYLVSYLISKNGLQAGLESSLFLILFSTVGHVGILFKILGRSPKLFVYYLFAMIVVFILVSWLLFRVIKDFHFLTEIFNVTSIILVVLQLISFGQLLKLRNPDKLTPPIEYSLNPASTPDIYYIILDGYGGGEMLLDIYDYDNSSTLDFFESNGFYVADQSKANYLRTVQSLSASLNLNYFSSNEWMEADQSFYTSIKYLVTNSLVKNQLEALGYSIYVVPSSYGLTTWEGAIRVGENPFGSTFLWEYLRTTGFSLFWLNLPYSAHREQIVNSFDLLENSVDLPGPKLVFAHILSPHPPFVFNPDGSKTQPNQPYSIADASDLSWPIEKYQSGYLDQLEYINTKIENTVSQILAESKDPPIIILQGDHGPGSLFDFEEFERNICFYERTSILNAYHLPDFDYDLLYPEISPINSFRVIFTHYFDLEFAFLTDLSFFSPESSSLVFTNVTESSDYQHCNP